MLDGLPPLARRVLRAWRAHRLPTQRGRWIVACSGGADSTALACLLREALPTLDLHLAHVDHGWLRHPAGLGHVDQLGRRLKAPVHALEAPPGRVRATEGEARRHRYAALVRLAQIQQADGIVLGHTLDDQGETVRMRELRGSGPMGLSGMPVLRWCDQGRRAVFRPLLGIRRYRLRRWLASKGVAWWEDPANRDPRHDRVRVRRALGARDALDLASQAALRRASLQQRVLDVFTPRAARPELHPWAGAIAVPRQVLVDLDPLSLQACLVALGRAIHADDTGPWLTRAHVARIRDCLQRKACLDLPGGLRIRASGRRAWLSHRRMPELEAPRVNAPSPSHVPAAPPWDDARLRTTPIGRWEPEVRRARPEDTFLPEGRDPDRGPVPVLAWLKRQGLPEEARRGTLVVVGASGVAWVVGQRRDQRHVPGPQDAAWTCQIHLPAMIGALPRAPLPSDEDDGTSDADSLVEAG